MRQDFRTEKQFKKDIKTSHKAELEIVLRICQDIFKTSGKWPTLQPAGVDYTGKFVKNIKEITIEPDFIIDGKYYEITRADKECPKLFHQKENKVKRAIENDHIIVFVNGFKTKEPKYFELDKKILISLNELSINTFKETLPLKVGDGKYTGRQVYRYKISWLNNAKSLPPLDLKLIPKKYSDYLKNIK